MQKGWRLRTAHAHFRAAAVAFGVIHGHIIIIIIIIIRSKGAVTARIRVGCRLRVRPGSESNPDPSRLDGRERGGPFLGRPIRVEPDSDPGRARSVARI